MPHRWPAAAGCRWAGALGGTSRVKSPSRWVWYLSGRLLAAPQTPVTFQPDPLWTDGKPVPVLPVSLAGAGSHPRARVPVGRMSGAGSGGDEVWLWLEVQ